MTKLTIKYITVLQMRVFQLFGNYMTESQASESHRGYIENQLVKRSKRFCCLYSVQEVNIE